jgi:hypothetical protein
LTMVRIMLLPVIMMRTRNIALSVVKLDYGVYLLLLRIAHLRMKAGGSEVMRMLRHFLQPSVLVH